MKQSREKTMEHWLNDPEWIKKSLEFTDWWNDVSEEEELAMCIYKGSEEEIRALIIKLREQITNYLREIALEETAFMDE